MNKEEEKEFYMTPDGSDEESEPLVEKKLVPKTGWPTQIGDFTYFDKLVDQTMHGLDKLDDSQKAAIFATFYVAYPSKYSRFSIEFTQMQFHSMNAGRIDDCCEHIFIEYITHYRRGSYIAYGVTSKRIRSTTFLRSFFKYALMYKLINPVNVTPWTKSEQFPIGADVAAKSEQETIIDDDYDQSDINFLSNYKNRYLWQELLWNDLYDRKKDEFKKADNRRVIWIEDREGLSGKSIFVKWFCVRYPDEACKLTFGTPTQLKTALLSTKIRLVYFLDIPKVNTDNLESVISVIEDLKNGHITTVMYGKFKTAIFNSPHVVIFSNSECPKKMLSRDRWSERKITKKTLTLVEDFLKKGKGK